MRTTRYIGYCPPCNGYYKVRDNVLVHHGYQRPGIGYIVGDCLGVHKPPHELSPELAEAYHEICEGHHRAAVLALKKPPTTLLYEDSYSPEGRAYFLKHRERLVIKIGRDHPEWDRTLERFIYKMEAQRDAMAREMKRMDELLVDWKPTPLKTVEEEQAAARAAQDIRRAARQAERDAKLAEVIAKYRARIDSAVRTQNADQLGRIYESIARNLSEKLRSSGTEAIAAVERDHVWKALGLPLEWPRWKTPEYDAMQSRLYMLDEIPWPRELGEPKRRREKR